MDGERDVKGEGDVEEEMSVKGEGRVWKMREGCEM